MVNLNVHNRKQFMSQIETFLPCAHNTNISMLQRQIEKYRVINLEELPKSRQRIKPNSGQ